VIVAMDRAIADAERSQEPHDIVVDKSRGQGATWMYLYIFMRRWLRDPLFSGGLVTRNEDLVDSRRDPDTLLWKFAWGLDRLPEWMLPQGYTRHINDHTILNNANRSTVVGYAATGDVARGGRKSAFALDELGALDWIRAESDQKALDSTGQVTYCRFLVSTFGADRGAFYEAATEDNDANKLILDWKDNPIQNRLAYVWNPEGTVEAVEEDEQEAVEQYIKENVRKLNRLERRGHSVYGKVRSPWYDAECGRAGANPRSVAKELDRNPRGAVGKVFDVDVLDRMAAECCRPPVWQGKPIIDPERCRVIGFVRQDGGPLKLWFKPGLDHLVPEGSYVIGCDISAGGSGAYSSNSVACGINASTHEQVFEYATKGLSATKFARVAVALARWAKKAYLGWEATGPTGTAFEKEVLEAQAYYNVFYRKIMQMGGSRIEKKPGWWNGSDSDKGLLFEQFCIGMDENEIIPRSGDMIRECGEYEWDENGKIVHAPTKHRGAAAGKAHGDRCIAAGVAYLLCTDRQDIGLDTGGSLSENPPYGCFAWREARDRAAWEAWDDERPLPTISDVLMD
jgi:hypothetical protein